MTRKADGIRRRWCKPSRRHNAAGAHGSTRSTDNTENAIGGYTP